MSDLRIRSLGPGDAEDLAGLLAADPPAYGRHFQPFPARVEDIVAVLGTAERDRFWGIFTDDGLAALVMLRGFEAGFDVPAFGVYVAQRHSTKGLGSLALGFAEAWCRLNGHRELMLTVDPDNGAARLLYEQKGFVHSGEQSPRGHLVYRKHLLRG